MSYLLLVLLLNVALLAVILVLQPLWRDIQHGMSYTLSNFDERKPLSKGEQRLAMVKNNQIETLALLIPVIYMLMHLNLGSEVIVNAALVHIIARALYVAVSLAGIPYLRSLFWAVSFGALGFMAWPLIWALV